MRRSDAQHGHIHPPISARRVPLPSRIAVAAAVLIVALLFAGTVPPPGGAASPAATVALSVQSQGSRFLITVSGTYTSSPSELDVYVHSGPQGCPALRKVENTRVEDQIQRLGTNAATVLINYLLDRNPGHFAQQGFWGGDVPTGRYWACAYLLIPRSAGHEPDDPPAAVASARLGAGGPAPAPTMRTSSVHIDAFYTISKAATDALLARRNAPRPPRTETFPGSTKQVYFYFRYRGARAGVTRYQIRLHVALGAGTVWEFDYDPHPLAVRTGNQLVLSSTNRYPTAGSSKAPLPAVYTVDLLIDGQQAATTSFSIAR